MKSTLKIEMFNSQEEDFVAASALSEYSAGSTCTCTCTCCVMNDVQNDVQ